MCAIPESMALAKLPTRSGGIVDTEEDRDRRNRFVLESAAKSAAIRLYPIKPIPMLLKRRKSRV